MISELLHRMSSDRLDRFEELLEGVGWHLIAGEPVPLNLQLDVPIETLPEVARAAIAKSVRRYRDRDFDGSITAIVGVIDIITERIYKTAGLGDHRKVPYHQRVIAAHKELESVFRARLVGMSPTEADLTWRGQERVVNGAADVLGAFRRNFSDAHGTGTASPELVQTALQSALYLINCLSSS